MNRHRGVSRHALVVGVLAFALAACGSVAAKTTTRPAPTTTTEPAGPGFGTSGVSNEQGVSYAITLEEVVEPAQPDSSLDAAPPGHVLVGVGFRISGAKGRSIDSASKDTSIVGSNGKRYTPVSGGIAGCKDFNNGQFSLSPFQPVLGCVAFHVPSGIKVAEVDWSTDDGSLSRWRQSNWNY